MPQDYLRLAEMHPRWPGDSWRQLRHSLPTASHAELTETGDICLLQQIFSAASAMHSLVLVSFAPVVLEDETLGHVLGYDDPTTKRPADYFELYNSAGNLLVIGWYDRFGIFAVDRGLSDKAQKPQGLFITLLYG